ncbi:hypothetical protein CCMSSC00406_0009680 [Pleurotus cornucopiae]|uniref:Uncharacterized protein n=1 Tax=Pleurotus cornucopiae TaxID=5321 RepID=A0ACB7J176_PLECO|nr:hypothetical protein CCMSSC00406_0009680 [Pleurotus cornucopiae]
MINTTSPATRQQAAQPSAIDPRSASYTESPLDKALAAFNATRLPKPKANSECTGFAKRWADVAPPSYRPSFGYLGEANPDLYGNPVAVESLRFVGAPLPWEVQGGGAEAQMQEITGGGGSKAIKATGAKAKAKAATGTNANSKAKHDKANAKVLVVPKKTPTSVVPKPPVQTGTGGRQTRSMSKTKASGANAGLSISTGPKKNALESDNIDARPAKRARVSVPEAGVAREAPKAESGEQEEAKMEKLVIRLPPLSVVCARSSDTVVNENEAKAAAVVDSALGAANKEGDAPAPLEASTQENAREILSNAQADENSSTNDDKEKDTCIAVVAEGTGSTEDIVA